MIPYLEQPSFSLGPVTLHAFGVILATAFVVGEFIYRKRLTRLGLDLTVGAGLGWWALVAGFASAHLFSLVIYFPHKLAAHPLLLFKFWEDVSSFGGMLGGAIGAAAFLALRGRALPRAVKWAYLDAAAFVLPFAWAIGRIACSLAHDHPGRITSFPLAVSLATPKARTFIAGAYADAGLRLPDGAPLEQLGFHDLGWYEFLYLACIVAPIFLWLDRRRGFPASRPGGWLVLFAMLYAPMRLLLDSLRIVDVRYGGFTPGQYAAAGMLVFAILLWRSQAVYSPQTLGDSNNINP